MRVYKILISLLIASPIFACSGSPVFSPTGTSAPIIVVQFTPETEWLIPIVQECSQSIPEYNWLIQSADNPIPDDIQVTIFLNWGEPENADPSTFTIATDTLQIVTHPSNPVQEISLSELQSIFEGRTTRWNEISENLPAEDIQIWIYPENSSLMKNFQISYGLTFNSITPLAFLSPHPSHLREKIAENPYAIGILSTRWLNESVNPLTVSGESPSLEIPITARLTREDSYIREWLACLQLKSNP